LPPDNSRRTGERCPGATVIETSRDRPERTPRSLGQLGVSDGTVRIHLQNICARLQVSNRTAAVSRAFPDLAAM